MRRRSEFGKAEAATSVKQDSVIKQAIKKKELQKPVWGPLESLQSNRLHIHQRTSHTAWQRMMASLLAEPLVDFTEGGQTFGPQASHSGELLITQGIPWRAHRDHKLVMGLTYF